MTAGGSCLVNLPYLLSVTTSEQTLNSDWFNCLSISELLPQNMSNYSGVYVVPFILMSFMNSSTPKCHPLGQDLIILWLIKYEIFFASGVCRRYSHSVPARIIWVQVRAQRPFYVELAYSARVCVGFLHVLQFPPVVQKHALQVHWLSLMVYLTPHPMLGGTGSKTVVMETG